MSQTPHTDDCIFSLANLGLAVAFICLGLLFITG